MAAAHRQMLAHLTRTRSAFDDPVKEQNFKESLRTAFSDCDRLRAAVDRDLRKAKVLGSTDLDFVRRASWREKLDQARERGAA
jgi:hypothetical protein